MSFALFFFFQAEDGIRDLVRSRGLGDVYKRQHPHIDIRLTTGNTAQVAEAIETGAAELGFVEGAVCLLYTSDAADERSSVDLGGRRIIKKKNRQNLQGRRNLNVRHV